MLQGGRGWRGQPRVCGPHWRTQSAGSQQAGSQPLGHGLPAHTADCTPHRGRAPVKPPLQLPQPQLDPALGISRKLVGAEIVPPCRQASSGAGFRRRREREREQWAGAPCRQARPACGSSSGQAATRAPEPAMHLAACSARPAAAGSRALPPAPPAPPATAWRAWTAQAACVLPQPPPGCAPAPARPAGKNRCVERRPAWMADESSSRGAVQQQGSGAAGQRGSGAAAVLPSSRAMQLLCSSHPAAARHAPREQRGVGAALSHALVARVAQAGGASVGDGVARSGAAGGGAQRRGRPPGVAVHRRARRQRAEAGARGQAPRRQQLGGPRGRQACVGAREPASSGSECS